MEGYGISELAQFSKKYIGVDKFDTHISDEIKKNNDIVFYKMEILHYITLSQIVLIM